MKSNLTQWKLKKNTILNFWLVNLKIWINRRFSRKCKNDLNEHDPIYKNMREIGENLKVLL